MKKEHARHGLTVAFEHMGRQHKGVIHNMDKADDGQVDIGQVEPAIEGSPHVVTKRYSDLVGDELPPVREPKEEEKEPTFDELIAGGYTPEAAAEALAKEARRTGKGKAQSTKTAP